MRSEDNNAKNRFFPAALTSDLDDGGYIAKSAKGQTLC